MEILFINSTSLYFHIHIHGRKETAFWDLHIRGDFAYRTKVHTLGCRYLGGIKIKLIVFLMLLSHACLSQLVTL